MNRPVARNRLSFFTLLIKQLFGTIHEEKLRGVLDLDLFDVEAVEAAEASLNQFIERRARDREDANREEEVWKESTRRVNQKRRRELRQEWIEHHGLMHRLHLGLASQHADKRSRLMLEDGYEPDETPGPEAA